LRFAGGRGDLALRGLVLFGRSLERDRRLRAPAGCGVGRSVSSQRLSWRLESRDPLTLSAFAALVGRRGDDELASFHLKRLLNAATGTIIDLE
jgi:adenylate cyclase